MIEHDFDPEKFAREMSIINETAYPGRAKGGKKDGSKKGKKGSEVRKTR